MEIISKITVYTGFGPAIFCAILTLVLVIILATFGDEINEDGWLSWVGFILLVATLVLLIFVPTKSEHYRVRINDSVTAKELTETYKIIEYDRDTDLWIVEKREEG